MKRKPRNPVIIDGKQSVNGLWDFLTTTDIYGDPAYLSLYPPLPTDDPNINKQIVPAGTPAPSYVLAIGLGFPDASSDTWYIQSVLSGTVTQPVEHLQAAIQTVSETGAQLTQAGAQILNAASGIASNIVPILVALAALFIWIERGKR